MALKILNTKKKPRDPKKRNDNLYMFKCEIFSLKNIYFTIKQEIYVVCMHMYSGMFRPILGNLIKKTIFLYYRIFCGLVIEFIITIYFPWTIGGTIINPD